MEPRSTVPDVEDLYAEIRSCCEVVHQRLGPGLVRAAYEQALYHELVNGRIPFQWRAPLPVYNRGVRLDARLMIDFVIRARVMVDVLAAPRLTEVHRSALHRRVLVAGLPLGVVVNFQSARLVLSRVVVRWVVAFCLNASRPRAALAAESIRRVNPC